MNDIYKKVIHVHKTASRTKQFVSTIDFFRDCEYGVINDNGKQVTIERAELDASKSHKVTNPNKGTGWNISWVVDIPCGDYLPSDESTEDKIIINYG